MLYYPINMHPYGTQEAVDASKIITFSLTVKGQSCNSYNLKIYDLNNNLIYTSGNVTLGTVVYGDQTLNMPVAANTLSNGLNYKWVAVLTPDNFTTTVTSYYAQFPTNSQCTLTLNYFANPITTANLTFNATYSQAQGVPIQWFEFVLKDSLGNIIDDTGKVYNTSLIQYPATKFLTGNNYTLQLTGQAQNGMMCDAGNTYITVSYAQSSTIIQPSATTDSTQDAVILDWSNAVQILGAGTGTISYTIFDNGSNAISIGASSNVVWKTNVTIPQQFTIPIICKFPVLPSGIFLQLTNQLSGQVYSVAYSSGVFTYIINGNTFTLNYSMIANTSCLIVLRPTSLYVRFFFDIGNIYGGVASTNIFNRIIDGGNSISSYEYFVNGGSANG